eukprot:888275_1
MTSSFFDNFLLLPHKNRQENEIPRVNVKEEYDKAMESGKTVRLLLIQRRQFVEDDDGDAHFRRCESQFMRSQHNTMRMRNWNGEMKLNQTIREVEYVINPRLINKFEKKKSALMEKYKFNDESELKIVLAWHGTKPQHIGSIVENNFDLSRLSASSGNTGYFGSGIYFSEYASISSGYGKGLLLCKVILGKAYRMKTTQQQNGRVLEEGYDSHLVVARNNNDYGQEIVIFDVDQILPCYVVKY